MVIADRQGTVDFCVAPQQKLGVPVIDGVKTAVKWAASRVTLGLSTTKRAEFARPLAKRYDGMLSSFSPSTK